MLGRRSRDAEKTPTTGEGGRSRRGSSAADSQDAHEAAEAREQPEATRSRSHTEAKGRPTPSRRQQEAARVRPLVPQDRKAAKIDDRAARREQRIEAQRGLAAGDTRYLPPRDQGEQKAFVRDWVDARWNVAELLLPLTLVALVFLLIPSGLQSIGIYVFYGLLAVAVLDTVLLVLGMRRAVTRRFGKRDGGLGFYAATRAMNLRSTRMPRPKVKRGQRPS